MAPAWRLPRERTQRLEALRWLKGRLASDLGVSALHVTPLGEGYFPSSGQTAEKVTPFGVEVDAESPPRGLRFVPLDQLLPNVDSIPDLHTRLGSFGNH